MDHPRMQSKVQECQKIIDYQFKDPYACWEALQMAGNGITKVGGRSIANGNKRLAVLGLNIISTVLSQSWYHGGMPEGRSKLKDPVKKKKAWYSQSLIDNGVVVLAIYDSLRQTIITNPNLGEVGMKKKLRQCVQLGNGQSEVSKKMMASTVEALVGAVFLDAGEQGITAAEGVMAHLGIVDETP